MGTGVSVREMADRENRIPTGRAWRGRAWPGRFRPRVQICKLEHYTGKAKLLRQRYARPKGDSGTLEHCGPICAHADRHTC